ncbi:hypothetical protein CMO88_03195 [Candidatus Woesearchaeota archaeon]|nr:hypothetical protein [Candidatus Woesearchaeota archaeon]|tara:strand:- start:2204 stop:3121 length:918 start_codon:yes stop_codon:yes gene_type:complete
MKRKVIQLAHKTLVVSLPSKWAKTYEVKKGAELEVEERGQQIIFSTSKHSASERIQLDITELDIDILRRRLLSSLYKTGYDEVELMYKDTKVLSAIQENINDMLIGFVVVEQGKNRCVLRVVAEEQEKEFENMLRRAFLVTKNLGESLYTYIKEGKLNQLHDLLSLEKTNNQLINFCERVLNKRGFKDDNKRCFVYVVAWNLEKIADDFRDLCKILASEPKSKVSKQSLELLKETTNYFTKYYEIYYTFDINKASELNKGGKELERRIVNLLKISKGTDTLLLTTLKDVVTKTSDFTASFIALNM